MYGVEYAILGKGALGMNECMANAPVPYHVPILCGEVLSLLLPERGGVFVDGTLGGGGHAEAVLQKLPGDGRLIGIDRDADAIAEAARRLSRYGDRFTAVRGSFFDMPRLLGDRGITAVRGVLLDLGVSSHQLDTPERGFSYRHDAPLDMRMDTRGGPTAAELVNTLDERALARIFRDYGEERFAQRIARRIVETRQAAPIRTTAALADIVKAAIPAKFRSEPQHPARRCFQALRIAVNGELDGLAAAVRGIAELLEPGGRMAVLTFHSLEDRIVKTEFRTMEHPCTCPKSAPICVCGKTPTARVLTRKPVTAGAAETEQNSRATSAKLRAIERL